ncbi:hypothetical protein CW304_20160 [Bacillus sp. UFRGS-B20]|nr:hypothetical protein CW304_20160 [Bacillus sp. UFRGS-B20]
MWPPTVTANDLCIRDLGLFSFEKIFKQYKIKRLIYLTYQIEIPRIYQKNPNPDYFQMARIKKGVQSNPIRLEVLMPLFKPGQTYENPDALCRNDLIKYQLV